MVTLTAQVKYPLKEIRELLGITKNELCRLTGLSRDAVNAIEEGGECKTHIEVARLIADALGVKIPEIDWPRGLSHLGRPPLTGVKTTRSTTFTSITVTETTVYGELICPQCHVTLPRTKVCGNCE